MKRCLIYNFPGEVDDLSHLFPNERLAQLAAVIKSAGKEVEIWDRADIHILNSLAPSLFKRKLASFFGGCIFKKIEQKLELNILEKFILGIPFKAISDSMAREMNRHFNKFILEESERILNSGFDFIFLNLWRAGFEHSMKLAELLKKKRDIPIYAIGQRVDWGKELLIKPYPQLDGAVLRLGYGAVKRLICGEPPEDIPNLIIRDKTRKLFFTPLETEDVNGLPSPCYDKNVYKGIEGLIPLIHISLSNQACPNNCAFCVRPANYGHRVIRKDITHIVDEVQELMKEGIHYFRIADSTPPPLALTEFAGEVIKRKLHTLDIHFTAFARVDMNKKEDFPLLKKANFEALFFGIESLDERNLKLINKGVTYNEIKQTLKEAHNAGLFIVGSFIYPLPGETEKSRQNTLCRIKEISPYLDSALIQPAGVYPYSPWGRNPQKHRIYLHPDYNEKIVNYPIKFIIPMRFWPPFPFSYEMMGKSAREVTFQDILREFESFSKALWRDCRICDVQDYTLLVSHMVRQNPYEFINEVKKILITCDYRKLRTTVQIARKGVKL